MSYPRGMPFSARLMERNFANPLTIPPVELIPERYSWKTFGGPESAEVVVKSTAEDSRAIWEMLEWLRCPIEIYDPNQTCVWWGYVDEIEINVGALTVGVRLESMSNRVATIYETDTNQKATTTWSQDDDSVAIYGTKEIVVTSTVLGISAAEKLRNTFISFYKKPIPQVTINDASDQISAKLICRGWWHTLGWKYYENSAGRESYEDISSTSQALGDANARLKLAQSFQISSSTAWNASTVKVRSSKVGAPIDDLVIGIYSDSGGVPGTLLSSGTIAGSSLSESQDWVEITLGSSVVLSPATTYWIVVNRSGSVSSVNYYKVGINEDLGYLSGSMKIWNNTAWVSRVPDADMPFQVNGVEETTSQLENIIASCGQFLSGAQIDAVSGVFVNPYRQGDNLGQFEAEELLSVGNSSGMRLTATVTRGRKVIISAEPALNSYYIEIFFLEDGSVLNIWGDKAYASKCPVGMWAKLKDVIPGSLDFGLLADPTVFFVEEASFEIANEKYIPVPRGQDSPFSVGTKITEG